MIEPLNLPKANLKLSKREGTVYVWCIIRKKHLVCTPEEWVRQHVIHFLINEKNIPLGLIASEYNLKYNGLSKRADIVVFNRNGNPVLLVECKATTVDINQETLFQASQYNFELDVSTLMLTNGKQHVFCRINSEKKTLDFEQDLNISID